MNTLLTFWRSTIGKKVVMGVTGLIGLGFVIGHMAGNLQAFSGAEKIDAYGALLHGPLHGKPQLRRGRATGSVTELVKPPNGRFARILFQILVG